MSKTTAEAWRDGYNEGREETREVYDRGYADGFAYALHLAKGGQRFALVLGILCGAAIAWAFGL